jgi:2-polyprenyl-3-methyl-5-hydroxy-6-metoxy-1,4-benzoquinol methylase
MENSHSDIKFEDVNGECLICGSRLRKWKSKKRLGILFQIMNCLHCKSAFINPRPSLKSILDFYSNSNGKKSEIKLELSKIITQEKLEPNSTVDANRFINNLNKLSGNPSEKNLLDIACGHGFFSKAAKDSQYSVTAIEISPPEKNIAEKLLGQPVLDTPFEKFYSDKKFSAILMSQVLEHVTDPAEWLKKANSLQDQGGVIILAVPNFRSIFSRVLKENDPFMIPPEHLNFFSEKGLRILLHKSGYEIIYSETVSRVPYSAIEKRFGPFSRFIHAVGIFFLKIIDHFGMGMFINIYARKLM